MLMARWDSAGGLAKPGFHWKCGGMDIHDYDFSLDPALIAQRPLENRAASRLMVLRRDRDNLLHIRFSDLPGLLSPGDLLVANDSRVIPARLFGVKEETGGVVEVLLLHPLSAPGVWQALVRPGRRVRTGARIRFGPLLSARVAGSSGDGTRTLEFSESGADLEAVFDQLGEMPLPPYIRERLADKERYQTVYARERGSVAAPTAGLHFTAELLDELRGRGVQTEFITLHVGLGTFRPVQAERLEDHRMHAEWFRAPAPVLRAIRETRERGRRVVSVGTTTVRALETAARQPAEEDGGVSGWTDIFIYPGFSFRMTDALLTNFHLPKSTLLMLVSALAGRERVLAAYAEAERERYRFFSFGDAMLIL